MKGDMTKQREAGRDKRNMKEKKERTSVNKEEKAKKIVRSILCVRIKGKEERPRLKRQDSVLVSRVFVEFCCRTPELKLRF